MRLVALAGNPNVGKSTLFNCLTGMNQHTGNWPGKTVSLAQGRCRFKGEEYRLVDLPGTYSLKSVSPEERVTEEFLRSGEADCVIVVCDATCLERSLLLALQVLRRTRRAVVCVNLMDEAARRGIRVDLRTLSALLGVPVAATQNGEGAQELMECVCGVCEGYLPVDDTAPPPTEEEMRELIDRAQQIARRTLTAETRSTHQKADDLLLHRVFGYAAMLLLLFGVFWLTVTGANYPSQGLQWCFDRLGAFLERTLGGILPAAVRGALLDGVYATVARVVAVMLPPMAIFFPLFTLLEDLGYLPRVAFLLDEPFRRAGACGKQSLTLCMGFGCNAVGVTGCRIIQSPRERLIAILTNAFVPCNGRFPALLFLIGLSFSGGSSVVQALLLTLCVLFSVGATLLASRVLSRTVLRGEPSAFLMELPPYRKPRVWQVLVRSLIDRTVFVLGRAAAVAAPAGLLIWLLSHCRIDGTTLLTLAARSLNAPASLLGMSGAVLLAFVLGIPANELVLPVLLLILGGSAASDADMGRVLLQNGWTWRQSLCTLLFFLFHWPCATTLLTVHAETGSRKWTLLAFALPTAFGAALCLLTNLLLSVFA